MWVLILSAFALPMVIVGVELATGVNNDADEVNTLIVVLCVLAIIEFAMVWLFWTSRLVVEIEEKGLRFSFFPLKRKWKRIDKSEIAAFKVRQYKPVREYGGWGIKAGRRKSGVAYNVSGNIGLQLYLKSGKKILLGTQKKQAIKHAMNKLVADVNLPGIDENKVAKEAKKQAGGKFKKILIILLIEIVLVILIFVLIQVFK